MCIHSSIQNKTDIVGSFLRPDRLKKAREQFAKKEITAEELKKVEDEEIINLVENKKKQDLQLYLMENLGKVTGISISSGDLTVLSIF
jgi:methionine synthase II (cobalamin-independent)